jgi:hypothetical protein
MERARRLAGLRSALTVVSLTVSTACFELAPPGEPHTAAPEEHDAHPFPNLTLPARGSWSEQIFGEQAARHASCTQGMPASLPLSPGEIVPPRASPDSAACEPGLPPARPCDEQTPCPEQSDVCVYPELGSSGLCVQSGWAPEYAVTLSYAGGACAKVVNGDQKQRLCCDEVPGVDCRKRTLGDGQSAPGEMCRLHSDCESGLLCVSPEDVRWLRGWGRCLCPGVPVDRIANHPDCESPGDRRPWGAEPAALAAACVAGTSEGWVVERLASGLTRQAFGVVMDDADALHFALERVQLSYLRVDALGSVTEPVAALPEPGFTSAPEQIDIMLDAEGAVHVLDAVRDLEGPLYAHKLDGKWVSQRLGKPVRAFSLFMASDHTPHLGLAWSDESAVRDLPLRDDAGIGALVIDGVIPFEVVHAGAGDQESFVYLDVSDLQRLLVGSSEVSPVDTLAQHLSASTSTAGDLLLAYEADYDNTLRLARLRGSEPAQPEDLWTPDAKHYVDDSAFPSMAVDPRDRVHIAHRAPEGLLLRVQDEGSWQVTHVAQEAARPRLLIDSLGEAHVFYVAAGELRHAHRGTCSTEGAP